MRDRAGQSCGSGLEKAEDLEGPEGDGLHLHAGEAGTGAAPAGPAAGAATAKDDWPHGVRFDAV